MRLWSRLVSGLRSGEIFNKFRLEWNGTKFVKHVEGNVQEELKPKKEITRKGKCPVVKRRNTQVSRVDLVVHESIDLYSPDHTARRLVGRTEGGKGEGGQEEKRERGPSLSSNRRMGHVPRVGDSRSST